MKQLMIVLFTVALIDAISAHNDIKSEGKKLLDGLDGKSKSQYC